MDGNFDAEVLAGASPNKRLTWEFKALKLDGVGRGWFGRHFSLKLTASLLLKMGVSFREEKPIWNSPAETNNVNFWDLYGLDLGYQNHQDAIARGSCGLLVALVAWKTDKEGLSRHPGADEGISHPVWGLKWIQSVGCFRSFNFSLTPSVGALYKEIYPRNFRWNYQPQLVFSPDFGSPQPKLTNKWLAGQGRQDANSQGARRNGETKPGCQPTGSTLRFFRVFF